MAMKKTTINDGGKYLETDSVLFHSSDFGEICFSSFTIQQIPLL